jgi:alkylglycerol monooxygenase
LNNIYFWLTPIIVLLLIMELIASYIMKKKVHTFQDSMSSFGTALLNQMMNLVVASLVFVTYGYMWEHWRFFTIQDSTLSFVILLVCIDFLFYWFHRWGHSINILWAAHMPHHSSEEMNLLVGLRASVTQRLFSFSVFWPLCLVGFKPETIYMATGVQLFLGYWHHTRLIGKMPGFEYIFNAPSYHRVHHGVNKKYLDKNFGEIFIIWDKLFGTYMPEDPNEEVIYGVFNHPKSWNPIDINFCFYKILWKDCLAADNWWDKIRIWFMPLGWRPRNLAKRPELPNITKENYRKFTTPMENSLRPYIILKCAIGLGLMYLAIDKNSPLHLNEKILVTVILLHMTINWGGMMKKASWAVRSEVFHMVSFVGLIIYWS